MKSSYGNYVVQKALKLSNGHSKTKLTNHIKKSIDKMVDKKLVKKWQHILDTIQGKNMALGKGHNFFRKRSHESIFSGDSANSHHSNNGKIFNHSFNSNDSIHSSAFSGKSSHSMNNEILLSRHNFNNLNFQCNNIKPLLLINAQTARQPYNLNCNEIKSRGSNSLINQPSLSFNRSTDINFVNTKTETDKSVFFNNMNVKIKNDEIFTSKSHENFLCANSLIIDQSSADQKYSNYFNKFKFDCVNNYINNNSLENRNNFFRKFYANHLVNNRFINYNNIINNNNVINNSINNTNKKFNYECLIKYNKN